MGKVELKLSIILAILTIGWLVNVVMMFEFDYSYMGIVLTRRLGVALAVLITILVWVVKIKGGLEIHED